MKTSIQVELKTPGLLVEFIQFLCEELNIEPDLIRVETHDEKNIFGMCLDMSKTEYLILVKENDRDIVDIFNTVAHEMIHVKQHIKENLGWFLDNRMDIPYRDRWWEQEAFGNSVNYVKKFAASLV